MYLAISAIRSSLLSALGSEYAGSGALLGVLSVGMGCDGTPVAS